MTTQSSSQLVSRRSTLAVLAGGGLGLAITAAGRSATAQDATSEMATHPVLGTWAVAFEPAKPAQHVVLITFHADGSMVWSHPFGGIGIGVWTATGDRAVDSMTRFQNIADTAGAYVPGTVTTWSSFTVEDDDTLSERAVVEVRDAQGAVVATFPHEAVSPFTRLTLEPAPPLDALEATPAS